MISADRFIIHRHFEVDSREQDYSVLVEESKNTHEENARRELDARIGPSLVDYQAWPSWAMQNTKAPYIHLYTLTMKTLFKP